MLKIYVRLSVCHGKLQIDSSFLFLDGIENHFMTTSTKHCSSIFDLGPLTPKIYSQKLGTKSPISRLVWQIDWRCLGLLGGCWGMADSMETCKMLWGRPLLPWQLNFGKFGLFFHKIAYTSACMAHRCRLDMFGTTRGPILVAIATTFRLGAESSGLPACSGFSSHS